MSNKFEAAKQIFKGGKYVFETVVPKISKNLTKLRKIKDEGFKSVDDQTKGTSVPNQKKSEIKKSFSEKVSNIFSEKKAKGGRVGLRFGTKKKSNIQKIKETFGPKQKPQSRMTKKKKKFPDLTGDGKVTFADILKGRGVINGKKKKKVI